MALTDFQSGTLRLLSGNRRAALREDAVVFHPGRICGAWPQIVR